MLSTWAMPGPSSGCFVITKSVCQHKIVKGGKLQESEPSLLCFVIAEGSANALLVFIKHPCPLLNSSLLAQQECPPSVSDQCHSVAGQRILKFVVIIVWRWGVHLYYRDVERNCPLADGDEPAEDWAASHDSVQDVLVNKKSNAMLLFTSFPLKKTLCPSSVVVSPKFHFFLMQWMYLFPWKWTSIIHEILVNVSSEYVY